MVQSRPYQSVVLLPSRSPASLPSDAFSKWGRTFTASAPQGNDRRQARHLFRYQKSKTDLVKRSTWRHLCIGHRPPDGVLCNSVGMTIHRMRSGDVFMKRIVMVGPVPPPTGGIASVMEDIIHSPLSQKYEFDVFSTSLPAPNWMRGPVTKILFRLLRFLQLFLRILKTRPCLVHVQSSGSGFFVTALYGVVARVAFARVLFHLHGTDWAKFYPNRRPWPRFLIRNLLQTPNHIVVLYSLWVDSLIEIGVRTPVAVLKNFIHDIPPPEQALVESTRKDLGLDKDSFVVLSVGSVGKRKGAFDILNAIPQIVSEEKSVRFIVAGGEEFPGEMDQVREVVKREELHHWVSLLGEVERPKIPLLFAAADVFLLPSHNEGLPISIIEALRSSVPVVTTPVGGIPDMVENGVSGLLIQPRDPDGIAEAILRLRRDASLREELALGGRRRFEEVFEVSKRIEELSAIYQRLIE